MIQKNLDGCKVMKELLGCDNTDCESIKVIPKTKKVQMKKEFEGGWVNWCNECIERDKDFIAECKGCGSIERESWITAIYHPFDNQPTSEDLLCEYCMDDIYWCEGCERYIYETNGMRINIRFDEDLGSMVCVSCLQKEWFVEGMPTFKDADWFLDSDLLREGFIQYEKYFCRSKESYKEVENEFVLLQDQGFLVIVSIEASGMGFEHHIALWVKEVDTE